MSQSWRPSTRRQVLRAGGLTMALPAFESLPARGFLYAAGAGGRTSSESSPAEAPRRFCCIFFPNGVSLPPQGHAAHEQWHWFPHEVGSDYRLTRPLQPLESLRSEMTILSGLSHPAMRHSIAHITADSFFDRS